MAERKSDIIDWLQSLEGDPLIGVDDGGLALQVVGEQELYYEIGGLPEDLLIVKLSHSPNPDIPGGYRSDVERPDGESRVESESLAEASETCLSYITQYELGGGNWTGGEVFNAEGEQVAYVSFNGKIWKGTGPTPDEEGEEITDADLKGEKRNFILP